MTPGSAFVDAGGLEECVPTVRGLPDHGDAWSRPWTGTPARATVKCEGFELVRSVGEEAGAVVATYRLTADPGFRFVWSAHALLDLGEKARLVAPGRDPVRIYPEAAPCSTSRGRPARPSSRGAGRTRSACRLDRLGPVDGSAAGAVLRCASVLVEDENDRLALRVEAPPGVPVGTALWRNLGGFPEGAPYRRHRRRTHAGHGLRRRGSRPGRRGGRARVGELSWRLVIAAERLNW